MKSYAEAQVYKSLSLVWVLLLVANYVDLVEGIILIHGCIICCNVHFQIWYRTLKSYTSAKNIECL